MTRSPLPHPLFALPEIPHPHLASDEDVVRWRTAKTGLDVESEVQHVAIGDDVFLAFDSVDALLARCGDAAA